MAWTASGPGGDSSERAAHLRYASSQAFATVLGDRSDEPWGHSGFGGDGSTVQGPLRDVHVPPSIIDRF